LLLQSALPDDDEPEDRKHTQDGIKSATAKVAILTLNGKTSKLMGV
jgi:hypothetical protein